MEEANWSEAVEDLLDAGDTDGAISLLETQVSKLQTLNSSNSALASALGDLATLYSSKGFSLKADDLRSRAQLLKLQPLSRYLSLSPLFGCWGNKLKPRLLFLVSVIISQMRIEFRLLMLLCLVIIQVLFLLHNRQLVILKRKKKSGFKLTFKYWFVCEGHPGKPIKSTEDENPGNGSSDDGTFLFFRIRMH